MLFYMTSIGNLIGNPWKTRAHE